MRRALLFALALALGAGGAWQLARRVRADLRAGRFALAAEPAEQRLCSALGPDLALFEALRTRLPIGAQLWLPYRVLADASAHTQALGRGSRLQALLPALRMRPVAIPAGAPLRTQGFDASYVLELAPFEQLVERAQWHTLASADGWWLGGAPEVSR